MSSEEGRKIWLDGKLVPWEEATVHALSHSHQRGSLVFDYMGVYSTSNGTAIFRLDDHIARFFDSLISVNMQLTCSREEVRDAVLKTVGVNAGARNVKISAFYPLVDFGLVPSNPSVSLIIAAFDPRKDSDTNVSDDDKVSREPVHVVVERKGRNRLSDSLAPQAKVAGNYTSPMIAKSLARIEGYDEVLFVCERGFLAEAPTSNLFLVNSKGDLCTPCEDSILPGITRRTILEIFSSEGKEVREIRAAPNMLLHAREAFLTGTSVGVRPIASVDGRLIGGGLPGPITRTLTGRFDRIVAGEDHKFEHWLTYVNEDMDTSIIESAS